MAFLLLFGGTVVLIIAGSVLYFPLLNIINDNKKRQEKLKKKVYPFKVIRNEPSPRSTEGRRAVAVLGSTGFVGSQLVKSFAETRRYKVCALGRRFNDTNTNPMADCVYQVDMMRMGTLENAFHEADTVIFSAVSLPTVFTTAEEIYEFNVMGAENVLIAARKMGVRNVILIAGMDFAQEHKNPEARALVKAFDQMKDMFVLANEYHTMNTCVLRFSQIYGADNHLYKSILNGEMRFFPLLEQFATFVPIEMVTEAVIKAEEKLNDNDSDACGKVINVTGAPSTFREFLTHWSLGVRIRHIPMVIVKAMALLNQFVANRTGFAPLGSTFSPAMASFFEVDEQSYNTEEFRNALQMSEAPPLNQGIPEMVAKFRNTR